MRRDLPASILDAMEAYRDARDAWGIDHEDQLEECKAAGDDLLEALDRWMACDDEEE